MRPRTVRLKTSLTLFIVLVTTIAPRMAHTQRGQPPRVNALIFDSVALSDLAVRLDAKATERVRLGSPSGATFISLGPPPRDSATLAIWLRASALLYGSDSVRIYDPDGIGDFAMRRWSAKTTDRSAFSTFEKLGRTERTDTAGFLDARRGTTCCRRDDVGYQGYRESRTRHVFEIPAVERSELPGTGWRALPAASRRAFDSLMALIPGRELRMGDSVRAAFGEKGPHADDVAFDGFNEQFIDDLAEAVRGKRPERQVLLTILDSGWPNEEDRRRSTAFLDSLERGALRDLGIDPRLLPPLPKLSRFKESGHPHVRIIDSALSPLGRIANDRLTILHMPLAVPASDTAVLRRLLLAHQLLDHQNKRLRIWPPQACAGKTNQAERLTCFRTNPLTTLPSGLASSIDIVVNRLGTRGDALHAFADELLTTADIFNAVWALMEIWSASNGRTRAYINASWTANVPASAMRTDAILNGRVTTIAAAGNSGSVFTSTRGDDFVQRAFGNVNKSFLLVENRRRNGRTMCESTTLSRAELGDSEMLTSHFGFVPSANACGTSFAAPRIAWVLAFGETLRRAACSETADQRRRTKAGAHSDPPVPSWPIAYLKSAAGKARLLPDPDCS